MAFKTCGARLAPDIVADHLGLGGGLRVMTEEEHRGMDVPAGRDVLDLGRVSW